MNTSEKVAYVKGLAEGLGYDDKSKEGKILAAILDILEDVAHDIEDLEENAWDPRRGHRPGQRRPLRDRGNSLRRGL